MAATTDAQGLPQRAREMRLVSALTRARQGGRASLTEGALFALGGAFAVGGLILIVVGWVGTSRTVLVAGQIPYVVSGGLLGVAMVFLGGFLYFGYWLALLVREMRERGMQQRADTLRVAAALEEVTHSLAAVATLLETGPQPPRRRARVADPG
jgi:hypothetical protein